LENLPNDIEPAVEIASNSFIYFSVSIIFGLLFLYFTIKFLLNLFNKKKNSKDEIISTLKNINWSNSKETAYKITRLGRLIAKGERSKKLLDDIIKSLEIYKYRASVPEMDKSIINKLNIFLEVVESE